MSFYVDSFGGGHGRNGGADNLPAEFVKAFPALTEVLVGRKEETTGNCLVPPATINLFVEGSQLKFCLIPKAGNRIAFGCVGKPVEGLVGLESAILGGKFEWKTSKRLRQ